MLWQVRFVDAGPNNPAFVHPAAHPQGKTVTVAGQESALALSWTEIRPQQILTSQRQNNSELQATAQDLHNVRRQQRAQLLAGRALFDILSDGLAGSITNTFEVQYDDQRRLMHLFVLSS
ncbi:hypothetical protein CCR75_006382 [Bremia lactucae]|uniref:Uncharacterized protein n=1 Tax=Bremia lactucae TaxID=4779 RepID=A0A976IFN7_BRELC|nr:hypothetical protein CCR75_006382 [Bremia lactucae]